MKCVCPSGGDRTCPDDCLLAVWHGLPAKDRKTQRKAIAEALYKQGYTMESIAAQLGVRDGTISKDLAKFLPTEEIKKHSRTASNPKGAGRPKGKKSERPHKSDRATQEQAAALFLDKGMSRDAVCAQTGLGQHEVQLAVERERGRREAVPEIDPGTLSISAVEKLALAIRQHQRKLDAQFEQRVLDEVKHRIDQIVLPHWKKQIDQAQQLFNRRRGAMDKVTFNKIRRGLHPDSRNSISDKMLAEAFDTFMGLEKFLLDEKDSPTLVGDGLPRNWEEWEKAKQAATAERRAKRNSHPLRPR